MSARSIPKDFVKSVLHNGVGRYVCQLQRLTLRFCKSRADSRGVRDFIENDLLEFTRNNPGIVVYLQPKRHGVPTLVGEYLNQNVVNLPVPKNDRLEVCKWVEHLRTRSGVDIVRLIKPWHTDSPSIQGVWTPFTNVHPSLATVEFPDPQLYAVRQREESATEILARFSTTGSKTIGVGLSRGGSDVVIGQKETVRTTAV